ncbi:hypothetical protein D3C78_346780 [compost metagenome]
MPTTTALRSRRRSRSTSDSQTAKPVTQRLAILLVIVLSLPLLFIGGRMLLAGIAGYQAEAFLQNWEKKGEEPDQQAWLIAYDAAQRAIDLYPVANGAYQHRLGQIQQWQQFRQPFGAEKAQASRRAALEAFRAATQARPTWPDHWAALAYAKLYLLEFDAEFHAALAQARELGPWRIDINRRLAEIGFIAWPQLDAAERDSILESARRTVAFSTQEAKSLLAIAAQTGMTSALCQSLNDDLKTSRKLCL